MIYHFHSPWWALLLIPLTSALILGVQRRPPALIVPTVVPFGKAAGARRAGLHNLPWFIYYLGFLSMVVALMRPQAGTERTIRKAEGIDIVLALDVSGSMEAYDLPADIRSENEAFAGIDRGAIRSRIAIAKEALERFVKRRPDDRLGLIAFSTLPYVACPPTLDQEFLLGHLQNLEAGTLGDHTGIAGPIAAATSRLKESSAKRRVLVLFTDGANNVDDRVTPEQAAEIAKTFDVVIYTVGIGSDRGYRVLNHPFAGRRLRQQGDAFNRELLETISGITGGRYFRAEDAAGFDQVMNEIDALEKTDVEQPVFIDYSERFLPWLLAGLVCVLLAHALDNTVFQTVP